MTADSIARLKITLDNVKPTVLRRIEVPLGIRLDRLHLVIQVAWAGPTAISTRSAPATSDGVFQTPTGAVASLDARKARLVDVQDVGVKTLKYLYDFGDGWQHTIKIEDIADATPGAA
jgi:hypothetical protein